MAVRGGGGGGGVSMETEIFGIHRPALSERANITKKKESEWEEEEEEGRSSSCIDRLANVHPLVLLPSSFFLLPFHFFLLAFTWFYFFIYFFFFFFFLLVGRIGRPFHLVLLPSVSSGRGPSGVGRYSSIRRLRSTPRPSGHATKKTKRSPKDSPQKRVFATSSTGNAFKWLPISSCLSASSPFTTKILI